jgi:NDP-sugar pyrophosphorylase family protein
MGPLGEHYPKPLLPVANEPLIAHHLRLLAGLGVRRVFVVVGFRGADVEREVGDGRRFGLEVRSVEQGPALGSAHALGRLRSEIDGPVIVLLGDYYFSPTAAGDPRRLVERLAAGCSVMVAKREPDLGLLREACELTTDADGRVTAIVEKPASPAGDLKGCGVYALTREIFDAVARTPRTALRDEYELSVALELFVAAGNPLYAEEIVGWDVNLTRPDDLLECNWKWLRQPGRDELVAEGARIAPGIRLTRAVIGGGSTVAGVAALEDVVVFPGTRLTAGPAELSSALVTPAGILDGLRPFVPPDG